MPARRPSILGVTTRGHSARSSLTTITGREGRERLAGLLWPDTSEQNARASLRQVLMDVREALNACGCHALVPGRQDVELTGHAIDVDLVRILDDIAAGKTPEVLLVQP